MDHVLPVDPELEAALRRLRAAFGFVEVLEVIHHRDQDRAPTPSDAPEQQGSDDQPSPEP
jgi:hypothetical protein